MLPAKHGSRPLNDLREAPRATSRRGGPLRLAHGKVPGAADGRRGHAFRAP
jgi:hypothetical protein